MIQSDTQTLTVPLAGGWDYPIVIGTGLLPHLGELIAPHVRSQRAVVISHPQIVAHWGDSVRQGLLTGGFDDPAVITFPAGERGKTLATMARLYQKLYNLPKPIDRKTVIVALGGGVVGDVAGFVAATYLRGLDYVQVPTTLLAMVDSSVGGKTGVDFEQGKNLIGAFHQPRTVVIDPDVLQTLSLRDRRAGLAEVVKYGVIRDPDLLRLVRDGAKTIVGTGKMDDVAVTRHVLAEIIFRSCQIKAEVVGADEREESGLRAHLNFGHTVGHALEAATGYRVYRHGEAIAMGMVSACCIGEAAHLTDPAVRVELVETLRSCGLPVGLPAEISDAALLGAMAYDKKKESGQVRWVMARAAGTIELVTLDTETVRAGWAEQRRAYPSTVPPTGATRKGRQ